MELYILISQFAVLQEALPADGDALGRTTVQRSRCCRPAETHSLSGNILI